MAAARSVRATREAGCSAKNLVSALDCRESPDLSNDEARQAKLKYTRTRLLRAARPTALPRAKRDANSDARKDKKLCRVGLGERGLDNYFDYGALPCSASNRKDLAAQMRLLLNQNFPSFVRENPHGLAHIPGFWVNDSGEPCLWFEKDYSRPMLLIPYRNPWGKIQSCQIRFYGSVNSGQKRFLWLSLPSMESAGSGTPIHYANWKDFGAACLNRPVLVTEGALKADVVAKFCSQFFIVANSGVGCAHDLIARITHGKKVCFAFDNDYHEKPAVIRYLAKLILLISDFDDIKSFTENIVILKWERRFKGIDDALLNAAKIVEVSLAEWICNLTTDNRKIVEKTFLETLKSQD